MSDEVRVPRRVLEEVRDRLRRILRICRGESVEPVG